MSGRGAERFAEVFGPLGMPVTVVGPEPGEAAARKLVRSVFAKGLAAAVGEALAAAERLEVEDWLHEEIARALEKADAAYLERLIDGSRRHAARRGDEMAAAVAMLEELGVEPRVSAAAEAWLRELGAAQRGVGMSEHPVPSQRARELVRGAFDMHVHIAPDVVERRIDDLGLARRFQEVGLAGFVLKSHYTSTAERAAVVRAAVPGSRCWARSRSTPRSAA